MEANMDHLEGYADGLAGVGASEPCTYSDGVEIWATDYGNGFVLGSLDRKAMLARQDKAEG